MTKAPFEDWMQEVRSELQARGLDVAEAMDRYAFYRAYDEYGMKPDAAVEDYDSVDWEG